MATPNVGLYVPDADTPISPLVPIFAGMQGSVDTYLNRKGRAFPNNAARDVAIPSPVYGDFCTSGTGSGFEFQAYDGTTWQTVWSGASMGWVELLADTGWVSSGLDIVPASGWTISGYNVRKQGFRVHGQVVASRDTGITFNDDGDIPGGGAGDVPAFTLPTGWRNGSPFNTYLRVTRTGNMDMTAVSGTNGVVAITHGPQGRTFPAGTNAFFFIDHDIN